MKILFVLLEQKQLEKGFEDIFSSDPSDPELMDLQAIVLNFTLGELDLLNRVVITPVKYTPDPKDPLNPMIQRLQEQSLNNLKANILPVDPAKHHIPFLDKKTEDEFNGFKNLQVVKAIEDRMNDYLKNLEQPDRVPSKDEPKQLANIISSIYQKETPADQKELEKHHEKRITIIKKFVTDKLK